MKKISEIYSSYHYSILLEGEKVYKLPKTELALQRLIEVRNRSKALLHPSIDIPEIENGESISDYYPYSLNDYVLDNVKIIDISIAICEAIQYLHNHDVYGIDLKADHIRFDTNHNLKILDCFELNTICPSWNSPESVLSQKNTKQSDIYSFGNLFYYMCHEKLPFENNSPIKFLYSLINEKPKSNSIFKDIILKCLEKKPDDRFGSFEEIIANLKALLQAF